jgi:hypothetical protein
MRVFNGASLVATHTCTVVEGPNRIPLPDSAVWPPGVYTVELTGETFRSAARWVKL